jgi:hypothetical protein
MPIKVLVDSIDLTAVQKIIQLYNKKKQPNDVNLELLNRSEGGFMIKKKIFHELSGDENTKIKQLRWQYRYLRPYKFYSGFDLQEELLLYSCMKEILCENVLFED